MAENYKDNKKVILYTASGQFLAKKRYCNLFVKERFIYFVEDKKWDITQDKLNLLL